MPSLELPQLPQVEITDMAPNRPPDFILPSEKPDDPTAGTPWDAMAFDRDLVRRTTYTHVWLPEGDTPGRIISTRYHPLARSNNTCENNLDSGGLHNKLSAAHEIGVTGLRQVMEASGIFVSRTMAAQECPKGRTAIVETVDMILPSGRQFCRKVDEAVKARLTHVRFTEVPPFEYDAAGLVTPYGRDGRKPTSSLDMLPGGRKPTFKEFLFQLHDLLVHDLGYLGLAKQVAREVHRQARVAYEAMCQDGDLKLAKAFTLNTEAEIGAPELSNARVLSEGYEFRTFTPPRRFGGIFPNNQTAKSLTHYHLQTVAARAAAHYRREQKKAAA